MSDPKLFTPIKVRDLTVAHRAWVSPMCQYSADAGDGLPTDWHLVHYGSFAQGGFALIITEAAAISPEGRISPQDVGLWTDEQATAWRRITDFVHSQTLAVAGEELPVRIGVQLAHAGRKASTHRPFDPTNGAVDEEDGGWATVAPSPLPFQSTPPLPTPTELDEAGIADVIDDFRAAAIRASDAGFDVIEIHAAHGYLLHEFCSPLTNHRTDDWGGDFEGRTRLLVSVADAVRSEWDGPLFVRISATDWAKGGWDVESSARLAAVLAKHGVDLMDVSSGGNLPVRPPVGPGYQVGFAEQVRRDGGLPTAAVGLITEPAQSEAVLADGQADAILFARGALREPHWPQRAAHELGFAGALGLYQPQHRLGAWPQEG